MTQEEPNGGRDGGEAGSELTDDSPTPTVLVVEDEPALAELYASHLEEYRVHTALSGAEALDVLDEDVDVVLLDRKMPGMSGDEVLRELSRAEYGCEVAMVTAVVPETEVVGFEVADYLVKPVSGSELRRTVAQLLAIATHEETVREFVELSMKQVALESARESSELHDDPEYQRLNRRLGELTTTLGDLSGELSEAEFERFLEGIVDRMRSSDPEPRP